MRVNRYGKLLDTSITISPIRNSAGIIVGASKILRDITGQRRLNLIIASQKMALEQGMTGTPLEEILSCLSLAMEESVSRKVFACIKLLEQDGTHLRLAAAPSLPEAYYLRIARVPVTPFSGTCGSAAYRRAAVTTTDIATDPDWGAMRDHALASGLRACWCRPLLSSKGQLMGTFALYYPESRGPTEEEHRLVEYFLGTASLIIERRREMQELRCIEQTMNDETRTLETLNRLSKVLSSSLDVDAIVRQTVDALTQLTGAEYSAFYYNSMEKGRIFAPHYAVSTRQPQDKSDFSVPRGLLLFERAFRGKTVCMNDLTKSSLYKKRFREGLIPDSFLQVRSCMAIPVVSRQGNVLGGLFFGHVRPATFD
ncbi:MAG: GAF domain-containing protein, partial [Rickettsiales bacterium]|nr:GAF domain-containing protein [Rickettsiales bacterium]